MKPKEKAEELLYNGFENLMYDDVENTYARERLSKQCALIAVDEILSMGIMSKSGDWRMAKSYWQEVKQEIENL